MWREATEPEVVTVYDALRSPSVRVAGTALERRVALAVHEAKQGARECDACGFTNVVRAVSCVRCSATLVQDTNWSKVRAFLASGSSRQPEDASTPSADVSKLQRRIRCRCEWTRRINSECKLQWHHDEALCEPESISFALYVLQSQYSTAKAMAIEPEPASPASPACLSTDEVEFNEAEDGIRASETQLIKVTTRAEVAEDLRAVLDARVCALSTPAEADASQIAYATQARKSANVTLTVDNATTSQLPFPTKIAQFITSVAGIVGATDGMADTSSSLLKLQRESLLETSMEYLATLPLPLVRANIRVDFLGDPGIDAGGVYREWFLLVNEAIVRPEAGTFTCVDTQNQTFYPNPHSHELLGEDHLAHFLAVGRLLGRALLDGNVTGFHLALPLLKIILGQPVGVGDLQYFDPEVFSNLNWLLENDGVDALCLDFSVTEKLPSGGTRMVELVPGGYEIEVTDANKVEFVDAKLKYLLFESVQEQLFAFLTGVYEVVPA